MKTEDLQKMIIEAGVKLSPVRLLVARSLAEASGPMSGLDIEQNLATVDRSSITRTLGLFVNSGLVHTIEDGSGSVKYELCCIHSHDSLDSDSDLHPHFHCLDCGKTYCLADQSIPSFPLPSGFTARSVNFVVKGRCAACAAKR